MVTLEYDYSNRTLHAIKSDVMRYTWSTYFLVILCSSLVGDTFILIISVKYKAIRLGKVLVAIIQHIAVCDLMICVVSILPKVTSLIADRWVLGNVLCTACCLGRYYLYGVILSLVCAMPSVLLLILKYPLQSSTVTLKTVHQICGAFWLIASIGPVTTLILDYEWEINFSYKGYDCDFVLSKNIWRRMSTLMTAIFISILNCIVVTTTIRMIIMAKRIARKHGESLKWQRVLTKVFKAAIYCISSLPFAVYQIIELHNSVEEEFNHLHFYRLADSLLFLQIVSNLHVLTLKSIRKFFQTKMYNRHRNNLQAG